MKRSKFTDQGSAARIDGVDRIDGRRPFCARYGTLKVFRRLTFLAVPNKQLSVSVRIFFMIAFVHRLKRIQPAYPTV
jgi:hypothetical protein